MSGSKPRKILTAIGIAVAALIVIMIMGRCSAPSQTIIQQGDDSPAEEVVNAASAAAAALKTWGDSPPEILRVVRSLDDLAAPAYIVTARMGEENVYVVVLKTGDDLGRPLPACSRRGSSATGMGTAPGAPGRSRNRPAMANRRRILESLAHRRRHRTMDANRLRPPRTVSPI